MNTASSLFQEISENQIRLIFQHALGEPGIHGSRLLDGGLFNTTYQVTYGSSHKQAVLRLGPVNRHLLMGFEKHLMTAEQYVCQTCKALQIPCSEILACDISKKIIDRDFMIVKYIPSVVMSAAKLSEAEKDKAYFKMGEYLSKLHTVTNNQFGYVSRIQSGIGFDTWGEALLYEAKDILDRLRAHKALPEDTADRIEAIFEAHKPLLNDIKTPHLLHTDLWEGNVLLDADTYEVAAIIDGDRAIFGDVDFEFTYDWMLVPALFRGYGRDPQEKLSEDRKHRITLYQLYFALLEAYVWLVEYNNTELYEERKKRIYELDKLYNRKSTFLQPPPG